jgi:hypothetical protein
MISSKSYGLQNETRQYLRRLYAYGRELAPADVADIDNFVKGLKQLNLWQNIVCWPLRSIHNIGTGSTLLGLGGYINFNGTLINSPSWGINGITMISSSSQYITMGGAPPTIITQEVISMLVFSTNSTVNFSGFPRAWGRSPGGGGQVHNYQFNQRDNSRNYNWSTGDGVSIAIQQIVTIGPNTNKHSLIGSAKANGIQTVKLDANATSSIANTCSQFSSLAGPLVVHGVPGSFSQDGEYSFVMVGNKQASPTQMDNLYALYKQTIGKGLGLP